MNPYSSLCDDFGVYVYLNTKMDLSFRPGDRPAFLRRPAENLSRR